jgi:hypothetical protein
MKTLYSLLLCMALAGTAAAQADVAGTWQGRLEIAPGKQMTIQFVVTNEAGKYSATVTSPDDGAIKNVRASSVKFADSKLTIDVPALSGGYAGTLRNGALEGEWSQEGSKLPLTLKPLKSLALTKEGIDTLKGEWSGPLKFGGLEVTIVLRFTTGPNGELRGVMDVPEQTAKDLPGSDISLDDGHFTFAQQNAQARIKGVLKGDQIVGEWQQLGNTVPLTLKKGARAAKYLDLPAASRDQVKGRWSGTLNGLAVVVRFEPDAQGRTLGFFDSVQQGIPNIPITQANLTGTKFTFGLGGIGGKFVGDLADGKLTGEWTQSGLPKPLPFVLTREK